jgi:hypothetical protein
MTKWTRDGQASYLDRTAGFLHVLVNFEKLSCKLVHFDGISEGISEELVVVGNLKTIQKLVKS